MSVTVNIASSEDGAKVARLTHDLIAELADGAPLPALSEYQVTTTKLLESGQFWSLIAHDSDGTPIGVLNLNECAAIYAGGLFGEITEFYVAPQARSKGTGALLVKAAADFARERGWPRLEVGAPPLPDWERTVNFYQSRGFVHVGPRLKLLLEN